MSDPVKPPAKIYLQFYEVESEFDEEEQATMNQLVPKENLLQVTWCVDKINATDVEYELAPSMGSLHYQLLAASMDILQTQEAKCVEMLHRLEWYRSETEHGTREMCMTCGQLRKDGHADDCDLALLLTELNGGYPE